MLGGGILWGQGAACCEGLDAEGARSAGCCGGGLDVGNLDTVEEGARGAGCWRGSSGTSFVSSHPR